MAFEIHSKVEDNLKIFPAGELDIYQSENFKNEVLSLYKENPMDIVFDFENLEYIDSTGLINNFDIERDDQNDMAFMVLRCLVDEVTLEDNKLLIKKTCNE